MTPNPSLSAPEYVGGYYCWQKPPPTSDGPLRTPEAAGRWMAVRFWGPEWNIRCRWWLLPNAVSMARKHKLNGVVWTYNDPVVWIDYVTDVSLAFKRAGMFTAMVTAGYMTVEALDQVGPQIDAFRFDLKAPGPRGWSWLTKVEDPAPSLEAAIRAQDEYGCHVEVTSNIVPGMNDDTASIKEMAAWVRDSLGKKTPWHLTRFFPDFELSYLGQTPVATLEEAVRLGKKEGLEFVYLS